MTPITTAIIGCGPRGHAHAAAARQGEAVRIRYACDIRPDRLDKAAAEWGVTGVADYRRILDDPEIEAVNVVTDVGNHLPIARAAIQAGKHLICEKPLGDDLEAARGLVALAEASDRVCYVSFQLRFSARYAAMRRAAAAIDPVQVFLGRSRGMMKDQYLKPSPFCGIMDFCAHDFDLVCWLMGRAPLAVTAVARRNTFTAATGALDALSALIDFGDGRGATMITSIGAPEIGEKCDITGARGNARTIPGGSLAGVTFEPCRSQGPKEPMTFPEGPAGSPDVGLQQAFQREIRGGEVSPAARPRDGLNSLLLTLACITSAQEHRRVSLETRAAEPA
ncbi:MAG: Gfo/Idh/MocA family oxidoreductase [Lentisphaeria bacterium]|nr:Gfo/Idh/MocA family oxidoreductase [Lentisphaeria bacterium]